MSYILDALRKSDQQRRFGAVPTLPAVTVAVAPPERPPMLLYGLSGLILIIATVTAVAWLRPQSPEAAVIASSTTPTSELPSRQRAIVILPQPVIVAAAEAPRLAMTAIAVHIPVEVAPVPRRKAPAAATLDASVGKAPADPGSPAKPVASSDLPASMRKQLPPISVAVHAYSSTPADRLVSINGRMLREGDILAPDLKLEQITPDGMIFAYRGYRFRRSAQ